jgi:hypothetical protein
LSAGTACNRWIEQESIHIVLVLKCGGVAAMYGGSWYAGCIERKRQVGSGIQSGDCMLVGCCCVLFVACRPAEDRKGVKDALVEMTKTSRAAVRPKNS